jgi:hypothetical protein
VCSGKLTHLTLGGFLIDVARNDLISVTRRRAGKGYCRLICDKHSRRRSPQPNAIDMSCTLIVCLSVCLLPPPSHFLLINL